MLAQIRHTHEKNPERSFWKHQWISQSPSSLKHWLKGKTIYLICASVVVVTKYQHKTRIPLWSWSDRLITSWLKMIIIIIIKITIPSKCQSSLMSGQVLEVPRFPLPLGTDQRGWNRISESETSWSAGTNRTSNGLDYLAAWVGAAQLNSAPKIGAISPSWFGCAKTHKAVCWNFCFTLSTNVFDFSPVFHAWFAIWLNFFAYGKQSSKR